MGTYAIRALEPARSRDFLDFFDHRGGPAFADNPEWASCYCQFYHTPKAVDWGKRGGDENRAAMAARIATGEMEGFLAYADPGGGSGETVVGWLNAQPRNKLPHCFARMRIAPTDSAEPDFRSALILCFVIHPQWRRRGVARALLDGACAALAARGLREIEGYPFKSGESQDATDHYHGPLSMYLDAGFAVVREDENLTVVRKSLAPR